MKANNRLAALILIALFVGVGVAYSLVVPPFETPDEPFHFAFAHHIAQGNGLPVQGEQSTGPWGQEGSQAPLYYLLTGWLTRGVHQEDFDAIAVRNERANIGDPLTPGNKNYMLYSGRQPPLQGSNLALHLGRWFSLLLAALTLWFTYLTAELACLNTRKGTGHTRPVSILAPPRSIPLLAVALVAAIPQFIFISAAFTNDNLIMAASAATVFWLARLLAKYDEAPIHLWEWLILGLLLGIAALSKLQGLGLIPLAGVVVLFLAWKRRDWRLPFAALLLVALPALAIAGWWYARNITLYGDWSGLSYLKAINGLRSEALTWEDFWPEFRGLRYSFWGLFGWFNILLPDWFYTVMDAVTLVGLAGLAGIFGYWGVEILRDRNAPISPMSHTPPILTPARRLNLSPRILVLLLLWAAESLALLIYWTLQATGSQGRLLFPGMIAFGILLAVGLDFWLRWLPSLVRRIAWATLFVGLLGMSAYALVVLLPASYNAPAPVAAIPPSAQPLDLSFGGDEPIRLLGIEVGDGRYHRGERVPVTLYWQADQPLNQDYQLFIQFLDENGHEVANLTSHPGWGRNPTTFWQPGAVYADPYEVLVTGAIDEQSPLLARVYTGFIDPTTVETSHLPLPARTRDGAEVTPFVASVILAAQRRPQLETYGLNPAASLFGDVIRLAGAGAPPQVVMATAATTATMDSVAAMQVITTTMLWEAIGTPATDYTAYVHLVDAAGNQIAGFDRAPAGDRFPTGRWQAGDRIVSEFLLPLPADLPSGDYTLWAGLYESNSDGAIRLPVTDAGGLVSGDGEVKIGDITVTR